MGWAHSLEKLLEFMLDFRSGIVVIGLVCGGIGKLTEAFGHVVTAVHDHCGRALVSRKDDEVGVGFKVLDGSSLRDCDV